MKNATEKGLGLGVIALLPICCVGLPLLLAAGISLTAAFAVGGAVLAGVVAGLVLAAVLLRRRARTRAHAFSDTGRSGRQGVVSGAGDR